jgi:cobalt/nickel transport system ATP-binding protein
VTAVSPAIVVKDLVFHYPDGSAALRRVDLTIEQGERVALLGPNGAGKTTLALHLNGILDLQQGSIEIAGLALNPSNLPEIRRRVQLVFADADDQLFMPTATQDVAFGPANLGLRGVELDQRVAEALDSVGAAHLAERVPHHLSTGEKRRVALATALAMEPDILVLDEPTAGLDPRGQRELVVLLRTLAPTLLVITHDLSLALALCPRTVVIDGGVTCADGPTRALLADDSLLAAHQLSLPYGFDRANLVD